MSPIEKVALFFFRQRQSIEQVFLPMQGGGSRAALLVGGAKTVLVHPKAYVAIYRKTGEKKHGLREGLLRYYAEKGYAVGILEEDTGTLALADADVMLDAAMDGVTPGAIEGAQEVTSFVPRRVFQLFDVNTGRAMMHGVE